MAAKRKGPGRPPLPKGVAKGSAISLKLSPSERGIADELAARLGITRATLLRRALLAVAQHPHLVETPGLK